MTLKGVKAVILRYFAKFGSSIQLRQSSESSTQTVCAKNVAQGI